MDGFEYQLKTLVKYAQERITPGAFAMYQPEFVTIGYFDVNGGLNVLADTRNTGDMLQTFSSLYSQLNQRIRELNSGHEL